MRSLGDSSAALEPKSLRSLATDFSKPIYVFVDQPHLQISGAGGITQDGTLIEVSVSYIFLLDPLDLEHPLNQSTTQPQSGFGEKEFLAGTPDWIRKRASIRGFPFFDGLITTGGEFETRAPQWSLIAELSLHLWKFERNEAGMVDPAQIGPDSPIPFVTEIDGAEIVGIQIAHGGYRGYAAAVGAQYFTAIVPNQFSEFVEPRFAAFRIESAEPE